MTEPNDKPAAPRCPCICHTIDSHGYAVYAVQRCEHCLKGVPFPICPACGVVVSTSWDNHECADSAVSAEPHTCDEFCARCGIHTKPAVPPEARATALTAEQFHREVWRKRQHVGDSQRDFFMEMEAFADEHTADLQRQLEQAQGELRTIDSILERRPALDLPTRAENINKAISVAKQADRLAAEVERLRELMGRIHDKLKVILPKVDGIIGLQQARTGERIYDGPTLVEEMKELAALRTQQEGQ